MRNVAFYKFVALENLPELKSKLLAKMRELDLYGTILLAFEGINGGLAGTNRAIASFQDFLQQEKAFRELSFKESDSGEVPYKKRLVKIKKEIVSMGVAEMSPPLVEADRLEPLELQRWFQEKKDFILLDTRNNYEYELGTFENAVAIDVDHFRHFPEKAKRLPENWKEKTVVTFCTGGIRCEKAAPYLNTLGFKNVFQLDGGILRYFAEVGGEHWQGDCFVFDNRIAVDAKLEATGAAICPSCQKIIEKEYQGHCPDCEQP